MSTEKNKQQEIKEEAVVENQASVEKEAVMEDQVDVEAKEEKTVTAVAVDREKVEKTLRASVYAAMGVGFVPIALFDLAAVTAINLNLARQLSKLYEIEFKESTAKNIIVSLTGAGASTLASPLVQTAVIGVPLIGFPLAVGTNSMLNGMCTYAVGRMFVTHFERGGNFVGANMDSMKEDFKASYQNSREKLGDMISGKKAAGVESR